MIKGIWFCTWKRAFFHSWIVLIIQHEAGLLQMVWSLCIHNKLEWDYILILPQSPPAVPREIQRTKASRILLHIYLISRSDINLVIKEHTPKTSSWSNKNLWSFSTKVSMWSGGSTQLFQVSPEKSCGEGLFHCNFPCPLELYNVFFGGKAAKIRVCTHSKRNNEQCIFLSCICAHRANHYSHTVPFTFAICRERKWK